MFAGGGCDSYSVSQSQSINFSQAMRARPQGAPQQAQSQQGGPPLGQYLLTKLIAVHYWIDASYIMGNARAGQSGW